MLAVTAIALLHGVAVGQQNGIAVLVCLQAHSIDRHHIGAIQKIGDFPKSLGFTLGTEIPAGLVQTFQGGIGLRADGRLNTQFELCRHLGDLQGLMGLCKLSGTQAMPVKFDIIQFQVFTVQHQCSAQTRRVRIANYLQSGGDYRRLLAKLKCQVDMRNQIRRRCIILQMYRQGMTFFHDVRENLDKAHSISKSGANFIAIRLT